MRDKTIGYNKAPISHGVLFFRFRNALNLCNNLLRDPVMTGVDFSYLLNMIPNSFMSRRNTIVVPGGKMGFRHATGSGTHHSLHVG